MDGYEEFLLTVRRDINCLSDADRTTRAKALDRLEKALISGDKRGKVASPDFVQRLFLEELHKPLFRMLGDSSQKCRELSLAMVPAFVDQLPLPDVENLLPLLLSGLLGRVRQLPFPEQSEEIRLEVLKLVRHLVDLCKERLNPFAGDVIDALAKALTDTCPDSKKECCEIVKKVSGCFDEERLSRVGGPLVASLLGNLRHQQWKVRRATLDALGTLLCLEAPMMDHLEDVLPHLAAPNAVLNDRNVAVRQCLAEVVERWLLKGLTFRAPAAAAIDFDGGPEGFEKYEHRLLLLLLSSVADEDTEQVGRSAFGALERVAALKQEARVKKVAREREKLAAKKMRDSSIDAEAAAVAALAEIPDIEMPPAFDYAATGSLLPEPFGGGRLPQALTTAYVQLHLHKVLPQILSSVTGWTNDIRMAAVRLLRVTLVLVNKQIAPFLDQVLVHLYKASADDEKPVARAALGAGELLGAFVDVDIILRLVARHLGLKLDSAATAAAAATQGTEDLFPESRRGRQTTRTVQDVTTGIQNFAAVSIENKRQVLSVLAQLLRPVMPGASASRLSLSDIQLVLLLLEDSAQNEELLPWALAVARSLLDTGSSRCVEEWPRVFDLLLRMRSSEECDHSIVDGCMDDLAARCGRSRQALYEEHLRTRLGELLLGAESELWDDRSPKRQVLETLVRNSGAAVAEHLGLLSAVLPRQVSPEDASVPARIDLLGLVHFLVTDAADSHPAINAALRQHAPLLLEGTLIPNCVWKAGQSNTKIRKGGMVCVHAMLQRHLIIPAALNGAFSDLLPILKSCLDDSWSPDNRYIACLVLGCVLEDLQAEISAEQLREVYPEMLKRLDDSNDAIRTAACEALRVFFNCLPPGWSRSLYEYILRTLFVHLDDPNPDIQRGIFAVLEAAIRQDAGIFVQEARAAAAKSAHPRACEELLRLAEAHQQKEGAGGEPVAATA